MQFGRFSWPRALVATQKQKQKLVHAIWTTPGQSSYTATRPDSGLLQSKTVEFSGADDDKKDSEKHRD